MICLIDFTSRADKRLLGAHEKTLYKVRCTDCLLSRGVLPVNDCVMVVIRNLETGHFVTIAFWIVSV